MNKNELNIHQVVGRLVQDPLVKETKSGKRVMSFDLAYNTLQSTDPDGSHANFISIEAWDRIADIFAPILTKGLQVIINGDLVQNRWVDKDGKKRQDFKLVAQAITINDLKFRMPEEQKKAA